MASAPRYASPLRYPGGKTKMTNWLVDQMDSWYGFMDLEIWFEPFGGGAGAALTAVMSGQVSEARIAEANPALAAFWLTVMEDGEQLARKVEGTEPTVELFEQSKQLVGAALAGDELDRFELGFAAFLVNRCSRSGMIFPNVGPIGGKAQAGRDTVSSRFNAPALAQRIRAVNQLGENFKIYPGDGISMLEQLPESGIGDEVFCFVDPPYIGVGNDLYAIGMDDNLHRRLAVALNNLHSPWILTYDAHPQIFELYPRRSVTEFDIRHTAAASRTGKEYLILGPGMEAPQVNPMGRGNFVNIAA